LGVFLAGIGLLNIAGCIRAIFTGEYKYGRPGVWVNIEKKEDRPFGFWFVIVFMFFISAAMLMGGIWGFYQ